MIIRPMDRMQNNSFDTLQLLTFSLVFSSKTANKEIHRTHKRGLRVLYKDNNLSFDKCLMEEAGITINVKNLHNTMLKVFKTLNYLSPSHRLDLLDMKQVEYNLGTKNLMIGPQIKRKFMK